MQQQQQRPSTPAKVQQWRVWEAQAVGNASEASLQQLASDVDATGDAQAGKGLSGGGAAAAVAARVALVGAGEGDGQRKPGVEGAAAGGAVALCVEPSEWGASRGKGGPGLRVTWWTQFRWVLQDWLSCQGRGGDELWGGVPSILTLSLAL